MFKFNFDGEGDSADLINEAPRPDEPPLSASRSQQQRPFNEIGLSDLLDTLPPRISCSPLSVTLSSGRELKLSRRDLFDARFQLMSESEDVHGKERIKGDGSTELQFLDAPSDLIPGVYEGGLKTWECSLDLVSYLYDFKEQGALGTVVKGRILELGCGTAIPSLYLLHEMFSLPPDGVRPSEINFQDYNRSVIELVTLPNVLLTWFMSPASAAYRASNPDTLPPANPSVPMELQISPPLLTAFCDSLSAYAITLRFFSGSWEMFDLSGPYDIVLTSETIYRPDSLRALIAALKSSCADGESLCLVAAKVLYFGVGGGIGEFARLVKEQAGSVDTVWEHRVGVGRRVMRVRWKIPVLH